LFSPTPAVAVTISVDFRAASTRLDPHNSYNRGEREEQTVYHVYIFANLYGVLYIGVTNFLERRILEHRTGDISGFIKKYEVQRLVHFEAFGDIRTAIGREKQRKAWRREKKVALIRNQCQICGSEQGIALWARRPLG
jgi:putative endonuclease